MKAFSFAENMLRQLTKFSTFEKKIELQRQHRHTDMK